MIAEPGWTNYLVDKVPLSIAELKKLKALLLN
jgi:hypothetical protein